MKKRFLSIILAICMAVLLMPVMQTTTYAAEGETGSSPSVTAFATKDQLMKSFTRNNGEDHITIGKVVFGKNYKGKVQEWIILGEDTGVRGDNTMIFATNTLTERLKFRNVIDNNIPYSSAWGCEYELNTPSTVLANHYGSSDLRAALKDIAVDTNYFTTAEQRMMNTTRIRTPAYLSSTPYFISDKLYAPGATVISGSGRKSYHVFVGSPSYTSIHKDYAYYNNVDGYKGEQYWSRDEYVLTNTSLYVVDCDKITIGNDLFIAKHYVRPAGNLNLSNVLFASAAEASSNGVASGTIESDKAMTLRLDGSNKYVGVVSYDANSGVIKAYRTSWLDQTTVSLVVQGNDGTRDWYYSMPISGLGEMLSTVVSKEQIESACGVSGLSLADCKIWLEKTDSDARMTYAVMAEEKEIPAYRIEDINLLSMTPTPENAFPKKPVCITSWISSSNITYTTNVDGSEVAVTGLADWNTTYKATATLRTSFYNNDPRVFASNVSVTIDGTLLSDRFSPNADGTLTITREFTTEKRKSITGITPPSVPAGNTFTTYYGYNGYAALPVNGSELGTQATAAVLDKKDNTTKNESMNVTWAIANDGGTGYDKTPGATNTFQWTIPANALADYDVTSCSGYDSSTGTITGTVSITNKATTPVTISGTDSSIAYTGETIDVSQYFTIDRNAGAATYSLLTDAEGGTGAGTLSGSNLSVIGIGTFKIKVNTAANGIYAAGEKTITLTVDNGTILYTASDYSGFYDGQSHGIGVNVSDSSGTVVTYSTDGATYGSENPSFTDAGTYTVYYRIQKDNYDKVEGSKTVTINKKAVSITASEQSIMWGNTIDQGAYSVSENGIATSDRIAAITLTPSTADRTDDGTISINGVKIENTAVGDVTGNYDITLVNGSLEITHNTSLAPESIDAIKNKTSYMLGETLNVDDITVTAYYADGYSEDVTDYTTNAAGIDMFKAEQKTLTVSYSKNGGTKTADITITVTNDHKDENKDHKCEICGATVSEHAGGEATCISKAICEYCGNEYGEVDRSNHNLENIPAKDATVTETGNTEYWHCKDCGKYFSDKDGKNSIELKDTVIAKLPLEIIEGIGQSIVAGEAKALSFTSNAEFDDFIRVELDGNTLDEMNYTVKEGSTIVTLKADYVATLSVGEYTIGIVSTIGTASTTFTVTKAQKPTGGNLTDPTGGNPNNPIGNNPTESNSNGSAGNSSNTGSVKSVSRTGDNNHMILWITLLFASVGLLTVTGIYGKKKKNNR